MDLASLIRDVPDFPKQGIIFKDITPLLADADALVRVADEFTPEREPFFGRFRVHLAIGQPF